jgi:energy-coupling factor transport system ATP-binding protein
VAIASALLSGKDCLVFDEPTSGLDFRHMERTARLLASLGENQTVFIVTHDPELILRCCNYVLHLEDGRVKSQYALNKESTAEMLRFFEK